MTAGINLLETIAYFLNLTGKSAVLWNVIPLAIATIVIIVYFEIHNEERQRWDSYLTNSLILLFVSMSLLRYIFVLGGSEVANLIDFPEKAGAAVLVLVIGLSLFRFNFGHILPERFARYISSPLVVNLIAYALILFIYSELELNWVVFFSLLIIIVILFVFLTALKVPLKRLHRYVEKEKEKERIKNLKEAKFEEDELKRELKERKKEFKLIKKKEIDEKAKEVRKARKALIKHRNKKRR